MPLDRPPSSPPPQRAQARAEAKAQLLLRLRAKGLRGPDAAARARRRPARKFRQARPMLDLALRDVAVPLPCGQTMEAPSALAQMLTPAGAAGRQHRILEIGGGSGYSAMACCRCSGARWSVVDCFERLAQEAREPTGAAERSTMSHLVWADGFEISPSFGLFDRIHRPRRARRGRRRNIAGRAGRGRRSGRAAPRCGRQRLRTNPLHTNRPSGEGLRAQAQGPWRAQNLLRGFFAAD